MNVLRDNDILFITFLCTVNHGHPNLSGINNVNIDNLFSRENFDSKLNYKDYLSISQDFATMHIDEEALTVVEGFGYPTYIIYPLATAKLLGLAAICTKLSKTLTEWAYAGFFFDFVLAFFAHYMINDGEHFFALIAIVLLLVSHVFGKKSSILLNKV